MSYIRTSAIVGVYISQSRIPCGTTADWVMATHLKRYLSEVPWCSTWVFELRYMLTPSGAHQVAFLGKTNDEYMLNMLKARNVTYTSKYCCTLWAYQYCTPIGCFSASTIMDHVRCGKDHSKKTNLSFVVLWWVYRLIRWDSTSVQYVWCEYDQCWVECECNVGNYYEDGSNIRWLICG